MSDSADSAKNRLAHATSPYLRQHADNPVDWFEWGDEALSHARTQGKPILLSVGYSSCHWCHVMAHESFEDPATAAVMNERFINIKVDREERPDIDAIYQKVVQLMGQGGGWPLTVFLTPDQKPFYGGTYFPKEAMYGRPSFSQVLQSIHDIFVNKPGEVEKQTAAFMQGFESIASIVDEGSELSASMAPLSDPGSLRLAAKRLAARVDAPWGGFGREPKFPNPTALELLLRVARGTGSAAQESGVALRLTLDRMYRGGVYDHLRGGFARYSVDRKWLVPHFEKMLYDNAQLLPLYAEAMVLWPDELGPPRVVDQTLTYLEQDMRTPEGVFYAATDADSEGVEGKYFSWTPAQIRDVVRDDALAELWMTVYDVTDDGNFEHGWSILNLPKPLSERAETLGLDVERLEARLSPAKDELLAHRYTRIPPHRDDKILTSWNALLVSGLARTAMALKVVGDGSGSDKALAMAVGALDHLLNRHVDAAGRVMRAAFEGKVHTRGFLDDVAYLARACLDVHEATLQPRYMERARALAQHALDHYARRGATEEGPTAGFHLTADDGETLIERTESQHDAAIPAGVGVVLELILRLDGATQAPPGGRQAAEAVMKRFAHGASQPFGYASLLSGSAYGSKDAQHVTLTGSDPCEPRARALAAAAWAARLRSPHPVTVSFEPGDALVAVVCRGQSCSAPITEVDALREALSG